MRRDDCYFAKLAGDNIVMKKNLFKRYFLAGAVVLLLLAVSVNLYAYQPPAPTWVSPENNSGKTYNTRPWLYFNVTNSNAQQINDIQIQIDNDSGFGSINYDRTASNGYAAEFYPLPANSNTEIRHRVDTALSTGTWYVRVRSKENYAPTASGSESRNWSNWSATLTITIDSTNWTDPTITAGSTLVKGAHFNELKTKIDNLRSFRGSGAGSYTNLPVSSGSLIKADDITDLRTAITAPYNEATGSNPSFTDTITGGATLIRKIHIDELRDDVPLP